MKIKLRDVADPDVRASLTNLVQVKLPAKVAHKLAKFAKQINAEFQDFNTTRDEIIRKIGVEDKEKSVIQVPPEKMDDFKREITELLEEEISVDFEPIHVNVLGDAILTPADLANLSFMFIDNEVKT